MTNILRRVRGLVDELSHRAAHWLTQTNYCCKLNACRWPLKTASEFEAFWCLLRAPMAPDTDACVWPKIIRNHDDPGKPRLCKWLSLPQGLQSSPIPIMIVLVIIINSITRIIIVVISNYPYNSRANSSNHSSITCTSLRVLMQSVLQE